MAKNMTSRPAMTPEGRELQIAAAAYDLAEKQILEGTASAQVIVHFLKLASPKERLEREILEKQKELMVAKTETLNSQRHSDEIYQKALDAMRVYGGNRSDEA